MCRFFTSVGRVYLGAIVFIGVAWIIDVPRYFGFSFLSAEWIGFLLAFGIAAAFLRYPYGERAGILDLVLGVAAICSWSWMSINYSHWIVDISGVTPEKYLPGILAIVLLMEVLRKSAGLPVTILAWVLIAYGLLGYIAPQLFEAGQFRAPMLIMYLYADTNGVPGQVLSVIGRLVVAFIILGKLMQVSGATAFFTELALSCMGRRRGGAAKVAVIASSIFGSINGTVVGNIMSTGVVTIPMMKKAGLKPYYAAAIEAVASTGGQLAPPVMGVTAFLIADFLQVSYAEVIIAAAVPAILYYVCLFSQVDAIAVRFGLHGLSKKELPNGYEELRKGWVFFLPLGFLLYLLFFRSLAPELAALGAAITLLVLSTIRNRRLPRKHQWLELIVGGGADVLPLLIIGGGAGVIIGVMNFTGLAFSLSLMLVEIGQSAGKLAMLGLTGGIAIILGMGMPTAALYVVLSVILVPAIVDIGVSPMAAHLFIFYFGLLSFITPPVAIASFVAAGLAGSRMWLTSWIGMQLAAAAYFLPFLWSYNDALLLQGPGLNNAYAVTTAVVAALLMAKALQTAALGTIVSLMNGVLLFAGALTVGSSTVWLGTDAGLALAVAGIGLVVLIALRSSG